MKKLIMVSAASLVFALAACSKSDQDKTSQDVNEAAAKVKADAKDVAQSPEVKKVGEEAKSALKDAAHVTKEAAKGAAAGARQGAADVENKSDAAKDEPAKK
jgi:protein involved in sex pheromone biosynthesis